MIFSKRCRVLQTQHANPCLCCHCCCTSARLSPVCMCEQEGNKCVVFSSFTSFSADKTQCADAPYLRTHPPFTVSSKMHGPKKSFRSQIYNKFKQKIHRKNIQFKQKFKKEQNYVSQKAVCPISGMFKLKEDLKLQKSSLKSMTQPWGTGVFLQ